MKKRDLKKLAFLGIAGAFSLQGHLNADVDNTDAEILKEIFSAASKMDSANDLDSNAPTVLSNLLAAGCGSKSCSHYIAEADEYSSYDSQQTTMTEDQLRNQLSDRGREIFDRLSPRGKELALKLATIRDKDGAVKLASQLQNRMSSTGGSFPQTSGSYPQTSSGSY